MEYPKISIVTPSFNQSKYLEQTILSVLSQNYPNLEYIIIDGGSIDNSIEIIRRYEKYLFYWVSKKDGGQASALNKGFKRASGEIYAWLNSDDLYLKDSLKSVAEVFMKYKDINFIYGDYYLLYPNNTMKLKKKVSFNYNICLYSYLMIPQPSCFFKRTLFENVGGINEGFKYCMDYDLFLRMGEIFKSKFIKEPLSVFRLHEASKSVIDKTKFKNENKLIREKILDKEWGFTEDIKQKYYLAKVVCKFLFERGEFVYKKERGKA